MLENVELKPWQDLWNKNYNLECERIKQWLSNNNLSATIYHIGSTSVRGMESRPIIDILVCPSIEMSLLDVVAVLERAGYICLYEHTDPACFDMMLGDKENLTATVKEELTDRGNLVLTVQNKNTDDDYAIKLTFPGEINQTATERDEETVTRWKFVWSDPKMEIVGGDLRVK